MSARPSESASTGHTPSFSHPATYPVAHSGGSASERKRPPSRRTRRWAATREWRSASSRRGDEPGVRASCSRRRRAAGSRRTGRAGTRPWHVTAAGEREPARDATARRRTGSCSTPPGTTPRLEHGLDRRRRHVDIEVELVRHRLVERQVCGVTGLQPGHLALAGGGVLVDGAPLYLKEPDPKGAPGWVGRRGAARPAPPTARTGRPRRRPAEPGRRTASAPGSSCRRRAVGVEDVALEQHRVGDRLHLVEGGHSPASLSNRLTASSQPRPWRSPRGTGRARRRCPAAAGATRCPGSAGPSRPARSSTGSPAATSLSQATGSTVSAPAVPLNHRAAEEQQQRCDALGARSRGTCWPPRRSRSCTAARATSRSSR